LNFDINFEIESERISTLPGTFEKLFLQAGILKRSGNFKSMFDSLLVGFDFHPNHLPYFDELVFSARATGQSIFLENLLRDTNKIDKDNLAYLSGILKLAAAQQSEALEYFSQADSLRPNDKNILFNLSQVCKELGEYKKAFKYLEQAKQNSKNDFYIKPKLIIAEGTLAYLSNDLQRAEKLYKHALEISKSCGDRISESKALIDLGICADANGNIEAARQYFNQGIKTAKEINDLESIAFGNAELGVSYTFTNELVDAKKHYLTGYELYKKLANTVRLALLSNNLGKLYMNFFDYKSALKYFEDGIQFAGDDKRAQALNLIGIADVNANLSNYSRALKYYRAAQKLSSEIEEAQLNSDINTGLGTLNFNLDKFSNAAFYYQYAIELQATTPNAYMAADIFHKLGLTYFRMDSLSSAENYFKSSIEAALTSKNFYVEGQAYTDLAELYFNKKDVNNSIKYLNKAKVISNRIQWERLAAELGILEGDINLSRSDFDGAKNSYQSALKISQHLNDFNLQVLANYSLAKLFHQKGFIDAAESFYNSGIKAVENISRPLFEESEVQISYFNSKRDLYDSYAKLLLEEKRFEEAFVVIDKSRSRNTMQNLLNLKLSAIKENQNSVDQLYELDWMVNSGIYNTQETDSLKSSLIMLKNSLYKKFPELKRFIENVQNDQIIELQNSLLDTDNFIALYLTNDKLYQFLITKYKFEAFENEVSKIDVERMISKVSPYYDQASGNKYFFNKDLFAFNAAAAYDLYAKTLKPVLEKVPHGEKIIFSPSAEFLPIPFEFIVTDFKSDESNYDYASKKFLIEQYAISYSQSASIFCEEVQNTLTNNDRVLIVGDPAIDSQTDEFAERRGLLEETVSTPRSFTLLPLKYSGEEVSMIGNIIKADKIFVSRDATETNFKQNAEMSKIIHLSTHSLLFKKQPLIFFSNFYDSENDGFLEASEIVQLKLNSDLVVLSSCSSGLGEIDESEGIIGMTKAFFDAGAKSIIVSLWEVNDKYTSKLMKLFYQKLSEGYDKSEALRLAKVEFIKKHSPNPYYWAAFVLSGNTSKLELESASAFSPFIIPLLIGILFSILLYLIARRKKNIKIS
jgi:CHAT domain-containing protein/tetratricopeptide (TPR) repeat protein